MENGGYKESFARKETKYHVPSGTYEKLLGELKAYVKPDVYGDTRIFNIYYDTPDYRLIRKSIEKPIYKEKLESPFGPAAGPNTQLAQNIHGISQDVKDRMKKYFTTEQIVVLTGMAAVISADNIFESVLEIE